MTFLISYDAKALIAVTVLALIHFISGKNYGMNWIWHGRLLSAAGGTSIAYVIVQLLPELCKGQVVVQENIAGFFPFFERHVYVLALLGVIAFYGVEQLKEYRSGGYWINLSALAMLNFLIGYAIVDTNDPEIQPVILFVFAMGLHNFVIDHALRERDPINFSSYGRWIIVSALYAGWVLGYYTNIPQAAIALVVAFIGGGVMMNIFRHELPAEKGTRSFVAFTAGALIYTAVLLAIG